MSRVCCVGKPLSDARNWAADKGLSVSHNGNFSSLTSYGNDIVNNSVYGLKVTVQRAKF